MLAEPYKSENITATQCSKQLPYANTINSRKCRYKAKPSGLEKENSVEKRFIF